MKKYLSFSILPLAIICVVIATWFSYQTIYQPESITDSVSTSPDTLIESDFTTSDGIHLHYWFYDRHTDIVTVFFGGGGCGDSAQFRVMGAGAYTEHFGSVLTFDQRGCGKSEHDVPGNSINAARLAADVDELRAAIIPDKPIIIFGRSFGGVLATLYATSYPKNLVGAVLVAPGHFDAVLNARGGALIDKEINARILNEEYEYRREHYYDVISTGESNHDPDIDDLNQNSTNNYFEIFSITTVNHESWLTTLASTPTLIISGEFDAIVPPLAIDHMKLILPSATFVQIPGSGHYAEYTHSSEFLNVVEEWWQAL